MCCRRQPCCREESELFFGDTVFPVRFIPPHLTPQRAACKLAESVGEFIRDMKPGEEIVVERAPEGEQRFFTVTVRVKDA